MTIIAMDGDLQAIVDTVAGRIGRPALLEDRHQRVLAYSAQAEPMDTVRRSCILSRRATPEVIAWLRAAGVHLTRTPMRTPAAPELDLLPRVCVPIRHHDMLLGYLWFIDADHSLSEAQIGAAAAATVEVSRLLDRADRLRDLASLRAAEGARSLLSDDPRVRVKAAADLRADSLIADGPVTALVVPCAPGRADQTEQVLVRTRRRHGTRSTLHLIRRDHGMLLVCGAEPRPVADDLAAALTAAPGTPPADRPGGEAAVVVGMGRTYPRTADAAVSYAEAVRAARVGERIPGLGAVVAWPELGVYRLLSMVEPEVSAVHPGLAALLAGDAGGVLAATLETYLDLAGNAHATAQRLRLHRTTLYYRLQRIEHLAGTDLKDGGERLCLHLALKMARLRAEPATLTSQQ
ncbi:PucR family transcriptional regulator [Mangrovihabitans endophyticus]|uniref:Transcriptional regulator n=1 Tax=Mangrovihabitans endophyticus TaxID=1751298 RepID=A0A8J3C277_9ACTN|nr:PucR family transcriptional regulator [Mangrovihabitans endophyticus]GGL07933.1 transcriptional regulator [Mangrovihabitans endophyticus]